MNDDRVHREAFCRNLPELRDHFDGRDGELDAAVRAVLAGTSVLRVLADLGVPLYLLLGTPAPRGETPAGIVDGMTGHASGELYRCPGGLCGLRQTRAPGAPPPAQGRCWLRDRPLLVGEA